MNRSTIRAHKTRRRGAPTEPELPDLGDWLRLLRQRRGLSRPAAAEHLKIGFELLKKIETGGAACTPEVLTSFVTGYELDHAQQRYTIDLIQPPVPLASVAQLRARTDTREYRAKLDYLDGRSLLGAYIDPLKNVISANDHFRATLPSLEDHGDNLTRWYFHPGSTLPTSESLVTHWDSSADHLVASLRGSFGVHRDTPHALALYRELRGASTFTQRWDNQIALAYGHQTEQPIRLRDPATGQPYTVRVHLGAQDTSDLRLLIIYRDT